MISSDSSFRGSMELRFEHDEFMLSADGQLLRRDLSKKSITDSELREYGQDLMNVMMKHVGNVFCYSYGLRAVNEYVFASDSIEHSKKVMVLVAKSAMPGIWSRSLLLRDGVFAGTMLPYVDAAIEAGYGIVMVNAMNEEALEEVWEDLILPVELCTVDFVAFGYAGTLLSKVLDRNIEVGRCKIGGVCYIESKHDTQMYSALFKAVLKQHGIHWESSEIISYGQEIQLKLPPSKNRIPRPNCITISAGKIDSKVYSNAAYTVNSVMEGVFRFFKHPRSGEFAQNENLRARKCVRKRIRKQCSEVLPTGNDKTMNMTRGLNVNDFHLLKVVGKGAFGKVMLVRKRNGICAGQIYAMKVLKKEFVFRKKQVEHTMAERRIMQDIDHPFIVKLRFAFQNNDKLYLITDYYPGGTLYYHQQKASTFSERIVRFFAAQLVLALSTLHSVKIVYRDLKLENVLLDSDGYLALTDFGLSREEVTMDCKAKTFCGTPEYIAPELLKGSTYGQEVDWWSFGILLFELLSGKTPFYDRNRKVIFHNILNRDLRFPTDKYFSKDAKSLLRGLLVRDPSKRLGSGPRCAQEIMDHPFFDGIHWSLLYQKEIPSPFCPKTSCEADTQNIPTLYTKEKVVDSVVTSNLCSVQRNAFEDFSYVDERII